MNNVEKILKEYKGEEWTNAINKAYNKIKKDVNMDGFRKGNVPFDMFVKKNGYEPLYQDAIDIILNDEYNKVLEEAKNDPIVQPTIDIKAISKDSISIEYTIISRPEITLGEYKNLGIKKETVKVSKEEIADEIKHLQEHLAEIIEKEDGTVEKGNTVVIDFEGFVDGKTFEGGKSENYPLEIGSNTFIPGFEDGLIGMKKGEEKDLKLKFPENYTEELKGKDVVFKVKVNIIKERVLPEVNEDFFKDLGYNDIKTKEELETKVKEEIKKKKEQAADDKYINDCLEKAVSNMKVEINKEIIDDEVHRILSEVEEQLKRNGLTLEQYMQFTHQTHEDLHKQYEEPATNRVKQRLLLETIAEKEKFEVTKDDIDKRLEELAKYYGATKEEVLDGFGGTDAIKYDVKMRKALEVLKGE